MKISFKQSGGFAGIGLGGTVDTDSLSDDDKRRIEKILQDCNFYSLPEKLPPLNPSAADYLSFRITVEQGEKKHTVEASEDSMPPGLRDLFEFSTDQLKKKKPG